MVHGVLEQGHQEGGDAGAAAGAGCLDAGGVGRQLVEHVEDATALEDDVEVLVAGGAERGHGGTDLAVEVLTADLGGDLAPQGARDQARALGLVDRDAVAGDADDGDSSRREQEVGVDQLVGRISDLGIAVGEMRGRDQGVGSWLQCRRAHSWRESGEVAASAGLRAVIAKHAVAHIGQAVVMPWGRRVKNSQRF